MIKEQIHIQPKNYLTGLRQRMLMTEKEEEAISNNIVDLPQLKCIPYCWKQKRWCDRTAEGRLDPVQDGDLLKNYGHIPEVKKLVKRALTAWTYYTKFRDAKMWHRKDKETQFVQWYITPNKRVYTEKDILKVSLVKGVRLSVAGQEMLGIITTDGKKFRYLTGKSIIPKADA